MCDFRLFHSVNEIFVLHGCYTVRSRKSKDVCLINILDHIEILLVILKVAEFLQ
jgi:hypothetical protein